MFPEVILFSPAFYLFERNWSLILFVSLSRYHTYYLTGLVLIYNQLGLTCYAYVRYRLFCFVFVTSNEVQNILVLYLWRRNSNEELWEMGNAKQCDLKELVTVTQFAREAENVGDRAIYSRVPGCCERKCVRCPRRLRVPSLNKIAQTVVRPSPLWGFRAANCFRDLIVA